jgi:hypothetical protein
VVSSSLGVSMVLVIEGVASSEGGSFVPQSPQKVLVSGFSASHLGHLLAMVIPPPSFSKRISTQEKRVKLIIL